MRYQYVVILKKDSGRITDALSILLILSSVIAFSLTGLRDLRTAHSAGTYGTERGAAATISALLALAAAVILLVGLAVNLVLRRQGGTHIRYRYWLMVAALGWIGISPVPWIGAFFFGLAFLEYQTKRPLEIGFHHDRVVINTLIQRRFDWTAFNNVILRDGLLTLDFKTNRLIQKEVADDEEEDDADEEEFNAFCRDRLATAGNQAASTL
jgi:hypothetical protein